MIHLPTEYRYTYSAHRQAKTISLRRGGRWRQRLILLQLSHGVIMMALRYTQHSVIRYIHVARGALVGVLTVCH